MAKVSYEQDADRSLVAGRKVAVIGYGSQGHAHALNLKDSGVDVRVGLREGSGSVAKAEAAGLRVVPIDQAAAEADLIMMLLPDTEQRDVYESSIAPHLSGGDALFFAHGFNIRFGQITPPDGVDVGMVAPKGPGHLVRRTYEEGGGVPALVAAGYQPESAYFETLHEVKLIVDLIYEGGIANMRYSISDTAEYGDMTRGPRIVTDTTRAEMKQILDEIQTGKFAQEWILENQAGRPVFNALRKKSAEHPIEEVGDRLRSMMPWIGQGKAKPRDVSGG